MKFFYIFYIFGNLVHLNLGVILCYCSKEQSELDQDLDDVEEIEEEETGEETKIKGIILHFFRL